MKVTLSLITILIFFFLTNPLHAAKWLPAQGESCKTACFQEGLEAIKSGDYSKNGNPFYVCRTNAANEGKRAGYNLQPNWSQKCFVGYGGKEEGYTPYDCLCTEK